MNNTDVKKIENVDLSEGSTWRKMSAVWLTQCFDGPTAKLLVCHLTLLFIPH